jgi:hypothetical protein
MEVSRFQKDLTGIQLQHLSKEKKKETAKERAKEEARDKEEEEKERARERGEEEVEERAKSPLVAAQEWAAQSPAGHKALLFAASRGQESAVEVLVARGAKLKLNEVLGVHH